MQSGPAFIRENAPLVVLSACWFSCAVYLLTRSTTLFFSSLSLVASLDAWFVLSNPPLRRSEVADPASVRAMRRRRRRRTDAGALAIFNLFVIGIWVASGAGYFWPVWVLLGSALAVAVKALPWPDMVRERYAS